MALYLWTLVVFIVGMMVGGFLSDEKELKKSELQKIQRNS